jgi:hypothetical protein
MIKCDAGEKHSRIVFRHTRLWCTNVIICVIFAAPRAVDSFLGIEITSRYGRSLQKGIESISYKTHQYNTVISSKEGQSEGDQDVDETQANEAIVSQQQQRLSRVRSRVKDLARKMVSVPIHVASTITPMPHAVAAVLKDATLNAVDLAVEEGTFYDVFTSSDVCSQISI